MKWIFLSLHLTLPPLVGACTGILRTPVHTAPPSLKEGYLDIPFPPGEVGCGAKGKEDGMFAVLLTQGRLCVSLPKKNLLRTGQNMWPKPGVKKKGTGNI